MTLQERQEREAHRLKVARIIALDAVIIILVVAAAAAGIGYLTEGLKAAAAESQYSEAKQDVVESVTHDIDFAVVQAQGSPSTSWLYIPDTGIDYPLVQGRDNEQYLNTDAYGNPSKAGAIFINYANSRYLNDPKTIIFGHNMNDGSMFTPLHDYKDEEFGRSHTDAYIYLVDGTCKHYKLRYYLFTDPEDEPVYVIDTNASALDEAMRIKEEADIVYDEACGGGELICLSTCTYHTYRTVVVFEHVDNRRPIAGMSDKMQESISSDGMSGRLKGGAV